MKRLLLGQTEPTLLVEVAYRYNPRRFRFSVINGAWDGRVIEGRLYVGRDTASIPIRIFSDDQKLLSGHYQDVFIRYMNLQPQKG